MTSGMEKDRERRYAGVSELAADLASFISRTEIGAFDASVWAMSMPSCKMDSTDVTFVTKPIS